MRTLLATLLLSVGLPILGFAQNPAPDKPRPDSDPGQRLH